MILRAMAINLLDNPVWHALTGSHRTHAFGRGEARHYPRDVAPFSAIAEPSAQAYADLAADLPARTYSAGMTTRLAFAIATSIEPDILVLDEGLSAGDASFAEMAKQRIDSLLSRSRILIFASHSLELLQSWCNVAILLERGNIVCSGSVAEVIEVYQRGHVLPTSQQVA